METGNITVDPLAKVKQLRMTDLTRAGKAVTRDMRRQRPANGKMLVSSPTAPDSQNPLRFLIERALDEKPSKMEGNT